MTAVGTLDGGAISYVTREAKETAFIDEVQQKRFFYYLKRLQKRDFSRQCLTSRAGFQFISLPNLITPKWLQVKFFKDQSRNPIYSSYEMLGEIPTVVIENDIDAEIDNEEALGRYASLATAFMVTRIPDRFDGEIVTKWTNVLSDNQVGVR